MIIDDIKNASLYYALNPRFETAFDWIKAQDLSQIEPGRVDIHGDEIFAMVAEYDTRKEDDGLWEAHKYYIDLHFIISGSEMIGFANKDVMDIISDYDEVNDGYRLRGEGSFFIIKSSAFAMFYPQDAHMPKIAINESEPVKKCVIKVLI